MSNVDEKDFKWREFTEVWVIYALHKGTPVRYEYTHYNEIDPEIRAWSMFEIMKTSEDFDYIYVYTHLEKRSDGKRMALFTRSSNGVDAQVERESPHTQRPQR
jgi:hypothetical protein